MKVKCLDTVLYVNRIILYTNNEEFHYVLYSKDYTLYYLDSTEYEPLDLFEKYGELKIVSIVIEDNCAYIEVEE